MVVEVAKGMEIECALAARFRESSTSMSRAENWGTIQVREPAFVSLLSFSHYDHALVIGVFTAFASVAGCLYAVP